MKELLETLAKYLVDDPSQVDVSQIIDEKNLFILKLRVAKQDMGKVIGKQGKIAKAIRSLIKSLAVKEDKRVSVEIIQ